jgi:hypothetical protein
MTTDKDKGNVGIVDGSRVGERKNPAMPEACL